MEDLKVQIPENMIQKLVTQELRMAVVKALGKDPEAMVKLVVDAAMSAKAGYGGQTYFEAEVNKMIRDAAREVFRGWLDEHKHLLREALSQRLNRDGGKFIETVADKIIDGLASSFDVSCYLKIEHGHDDDDDD